MPDLKFTKPWHGIPREEIDWHPTVDADACIGCGNCVTSCGRLVYRFDFDTEKAVVVEPLHCMVGCMTCANTCPTHAIGFPDPHVLKPLINARAFRRGLREELATRRDDIEWHDVAPHCDRQLRMTVTGLSDDGPVRLVTLAPALAEEGLCQVMPGQHVQIVLDDDPLGHRAYPEYPAPRDDGSIVVRFDADARGRLAHWARHAARPGDEIAAWGPRGDFTLADTTHPLLLAAAGPGFAAIRELVDQARRLDRPDLLVLVAPTQRTIPDPTVLSRWAGAGGVDIHLAVSDGVGSPEPLPDGMTAHQGDLTSALDQLTARLAGRDCYVAARRPVAQQVTRRLMDAGVPAAAIHVDHLAT
jgi:CDP-4-dehydro-6-deoxyglucose reductase, E3